MTTSVSKPASPHSPMLVSRDGVSALAELAGEALDFDREDPDLVGWLLTARERRIRAGPSPVVDLLFPLGGPGPHVRGRLATGIGPGLRSYGLCTHDGACRLHERTRSGQLSLGPSCSTDQK